MLLSLRSNIQDSATRNGVLRNRFRPGTRRGDQIDPESMEALSNPRCASVDGFSVHANVAVSAGDRARLERLAQYCARGPVATERLEMLTDGRLLYRFKRAWRDGTTHIILMPLDMLAIARKIVRPNPGSPCPFGPICRSFGSSSKMEIRDRANSSIDGSRFHNPLLRRRNNSLLQRIRGQ